MSRWKKSNVMQWIRKYWLIEVILATLIGLLITACWDFVFSSDSEDVKVQTSFSRTNVKPTLVGIYPSDAYGTDQKLGLVASLDEYKGDFNVVHLDYLSLNEMKERRIDSYLNELKRLIENENVFAVIGPSVSESSRQILETIEGLENKPPIFLLTAASKKTLNWDKFRKSIPMYRICTDIDLRAKKITGFLKKMLHSDKRVGILVENNAEGISYGNQFLATIEKSFGAADFKRRINANDITIIDFKRSSLQSNIDNYRSVFDENDIVLFLGIGNDFKTFIDRFYQRGQSPRATFGGWLASYAYKEELRSEKYNSQKIFEITDFDINSQNFSSLPDNFEHFLSLDKKITPPERDFALGFDAAYIAAQSYNKISHSEPNFIKFDEYACKVFADAVSNTGGSQVWNGITGEINFAINGENMRDIQYVRYENDSWKTIDSVNEFIIKED